MSVVKDSCGRWDGFCDFAAWRTADGPTCTAGNPDKSGHPQDLRGTLNTLRGL